ncbi:uncharacterized protein [Ptychodera flava]|uniref:uncharacterized protein n=1 Tax=Ptychodera flava TaxID=63121 RepID=UPI00396A2750
MQLVTRAITLDLHSGVLFKRAIAVDRAQQRHAIMSWNDTPEYRNNHWNDGNFVGDTFCTESSTCYPPSTYDQDTVYDDVGLSSSSQNGTDVSQASSTDSYVKNLEEKFGANIMCAEADEDTVEHDILQPLENNGIPCYYPPRDRLPSVTIKDSIRRALKLHPVTILPITVDFNREWSDEKLSDFILIGQKVDFKRYIVVKMHDKAEIPTLFRSLGIIPIDFTKTGKRHSWELTKLLRAASKRIENCTGDKLQTENANKAEGQNERPNYVNKTENLQAKETNSHADEPTFTSVFDGDGHNSCMSGPQICKKSMEVTARSHKELNLKCSVPNGISHLNEIFQGLPKDNPRKRTTEQFIVGKIIPELRAKRDYRTLTDMLAMFNINVQTQVLEALYKSTILHIPDLDDLLSIEDLLSKSLQSPSSIPNLAHTARVYTNVVCSMLLFHAMNQHCGHQQTITCNLSGRSMQKWQTPTHPSKQIVMKYCRETITKAREMIEKVKQGNAGKLLVFKKRSKFAEEITSLREIIVDEDVSEKDVEECIRVIVADSWFDQFLKSTFIAHMIIANEEAHVKERALKMMQRFVYEKRNETSTKLLVHMSKLLVSILQFSSDEDFCAAVVDGLGDEMLGLREMWKSLKILNDKRSKDVAVQYMEEAIGPLIHHQCRAVRMHVTRRLLVKQDSDGESLVLSRAHEVYQQHILNTYLCQGLVIIGGKSKPSQYNQNPKFWSWMANMFEKPVKVNVLTPGSVKNFVEGFSRSSTSLKYFSQELDSLLKVTRHRNIVDIFAFQIRPRPNFIITEAWSENIAEFLIRRVKEDRQMSVYDLIKLILRPMLAAVMYCHEKGIILRDIVCTNFFIQRDDKGELRVKYHNFRLAKSLKCDTQLTTEDDNIYDEIDIEDIKGSKSDPVPTRYSAPESLLTYSYSVKSDSWMCSCAAYEVLTHGCQPYTELYGMKSGDVVKKVLMGYRMNQPSSIPDDLYMMILGAMIMRPNSRSSIREFDEQLADFQENSGSTAAAGMASLMAYHPPERDANQPLEPDRGIPEDLQMYNSSPMSFPTGKVMDCYPCTASEVRGADEPTLTQDRRSFLERICSDRSIEDSEKLKNLANEHIAQIVNIEHQEDFFLQKTRFDGGLPLLQVCQLKLYDADSVVGLLEQVAVGLQSAHSKGWAHCCLKAKYIYVNQGVAKIFRWGRAIRPEVRLYDKGPFEAVHIQQMPEDMRRWAPPETVSSGIFSQPGDVFMFSQICWEAFNALTEDQTEPEEHLVPYPHQHSHEIMDHLCRQERQLQPPVCPEWLYGLMKKMWLCEKSRRPPFSLILQCFKTKSLEPLTKSEKLHSGDLSLPLKRSVRIAFIQQRLSLDDQQSKYYERGSRNERKVKNQEISSYVKEKKDVKFRTQNHLYVNNGVAAVEIGAATKCLTHRPGESMNTTEVNMQQNRPTLPKC